MERSQHPSRSSRHKTTLRAAAQRSIWGSPWPDRRTCRTSTSCSPTLQNDQANLLPQAADDARPAQGPRPDHGRPGAADRRRHIPAIYTYFGQFVDHDITLEVRAAHLRRAAVLDHGPLPLAQIRNDLKNLRTATLDLDSVYGPPRPAASDNANKM